MDMAQGSRAVHDLSELVGLWTGQLDGKTVLKRSGRMVMDLNQQLDEIEREMMQLAEVTRAHNGTGLQLTLQRRATGAVALRWKAGAKALSAEALASRLDRLPAEAARWYRDTEASARWLNARERLVRHARQVMRDLYAVEN
ncbi:hypothetical protein EZJ19_07755 [Parasulfuritortus cantonensis]|uniref:Uncharacterized protein n=1 Tax=Parasulfuritortus cantonensis TaxID=2528202 RepID=A0A4R1BDL0_9PROT|nr:hypothetical protein [Parasulfuritortus cantonensis]TCJ15195.1 hypothetical protein EZJ19_07755 [Parasulfuritortus cantonensis]